MEPSTAVTSGLLIYGPLGIMCLGLGYACRELFKLYVASLEARVKDGKEIQSALVDSIATQKRAVEALDAQRVFLEVRFEAIRVTMDSLRERRQERAP
jgi:hypothetical protein